jgi:hypothetical protein
MWQGEFAIDGRVIGFEALVDPKPISELLDVKGELMFRTVYPTVAQEQSCVWRVLHKEAGSDSTSRGAWSSGCCQLSS